MTALDDFLRQNDVMSRKQSAFGSATALYQYCFENDNGTVPQLAEARKYVEHWEEMRRNNMGLLLWGMPGNGKTFAAACIANALCEKQVDVRMTTIGCALNALPSMTAKDKLFFLDDLKNCDLLILDDFGMECRTDYAQEQVFGIIDGRYLVRKPLVITTNLSVQEMKEPMDMTEKRIFDRILEVCVPICFDEPSLRQSKAEKNKARYKELTGR